ncbi:hypothetical protein SLEP1_g14995 [Rubroshorea leprosula]|uniref:RING-type domain-containing protein n=1 Tax=Rubroshorea leprosula TaxID=152421 RepID=A0AAV5ITT2_9ROSI|nr:hypothetical protein SLEP1_g14995 [Rubroshorea leprosula]
MHFGQNAWEIGGDLYFPLLLTHRIDGVVGATECSVCLQPYDGEYTIPRVLACGHTACESSLSNIPQKFPQAIRCPACTVVVKLPPQGLSLLPKSIDLLRLITASPLQNLPKPIDKCSNDFQISVSAVPPSSPSIIKLTGASSPSEWGENARLEIEIHGFRDEFEIHSF